MAQVRFRNEIETMKQLWLLFVVCILVACTSQTLWSGDKIVLSVIRDNFFESAETYVVSTDGSGKSEKLSLQSIDPLEWSPDSQWIVFSTVDSDYRNTALYIMRADGSQRTRINIKGRNPTWSPDGTCIAYNTAGDEIYVLDVRCVLRREECNFDPMFITEGTWPDWSPDGKYLAYEYAYQKGSDYRTSIYAISLDDTNAPINLTPDIDCLRPTWSPDGEKTAFSCHTKGPFSIFVADKDGSNRVNLTKGRHGFSPRWSPDGSKIAFISVYGEGLGKKFGWEGAKTTSAVFLMNADGSNTIRLTKRNDEMVRWFTWPPIATK